ncbi:MAG: hypothetical protein LH628_19915 [Microcoleus sp. CAN_BIN18]|nr:hypothetical protein [Microcoleus sp. CAN_BIN18]
MPAPQKLNFLSFCGVGFDAAQKTGKMPVPQKLNHLVGWASTPPKKQARCLFHKN